MIRVAISVEGPTELEFCKKVLVPYLRNYTIEMTPIVVTTSKDRCGRKNSGGCINKDRVKNEVSKLLYSYDAVTTFYDFYGFSKRDTDSVDELEEQLYNLINNPKFIPYIQKYEFETLLFSKPEYYEEYFGNSKVTNKMNEIITQFQDIELINDSIETSPSKRMEQLFQLNSEKYDKVFHGEGIANDIGMETICKHTKRFNNWIDILIQLSDNSTKNSTRLIRK